MKAMNFYPQNGWSGSNYDSKLSTKEIAAKVRSYAKKNFPGFKFSVRSEWSMYTDSMYIELKEGTCIAFVEGSRSAERGYMSTMSTVKGWKDELTPGMFKVLDAVTTYASSFRYDDSDGMQDYYDTNFYLKIKVSDEYKVVEPKAKKSGVNAEKVEEDKEVKAMTVEGIEVMDYSEKAVAVFGDTKVIKDQLKELGGRFNRSLNYNGEKRSGWIFSKKQADKVKELITPTELPALPEEIYIPELAEQPKTLEKSSIWNNLKTLDHSLYDDYKSGLLTLKECAREFCKSGWTNFVDIEYTKTVFNRMEKETAVIEWKEIPSIGYEAVELEYTGEGKEYGAIGRMDNGKYWGAFGGVKGSTGGLTPARKEFNNEADLLAWMKANGFIYKNKSNTGIEGQCDNAPLIIDDFAKYGCGDYPTECGELDGFKLGEVVFDQIGEIGVILAFYEKDGIARLNSNGCCNIGNLKKCPKAIAEKEVKYMDIIRPKKASDSYTVEAYEKKVKGKRYTVKNKPLTLGYYGVLDRLDNNVIDCYPTKEEALKEAERLNGFTDENGRLRRII